jgi:hypothetical protein
MNRFFTLYLLLVAMHTGARAQPAIYVNQVAFNTHSPKIALVSFDEKLTRKTAFQLVNAGTGKQVFTGVLSGPQSIDEWLPGKVFYEADLSAYNTPGKYKITVGTSASDVFTIGDNALGKLTLPAIVSYYNKQRANTPQELQADKKLLLFGSNKRVDLHGGWCDAGGDVSKYFSHLAYANFMSPQQIPLVTWSMLNASESMPAALNSLHIKNALDNEALYGADYIVRSLAKEGYFYMTVFSYFSKNPNDRRVVGLNANSVTTNKYESAFREGGGMGIAALARAARWQKHGEYTQAQYLAAAKKGFAHLLINNKKYCDDGKENIIDDYCALMAATELWITTNQTLYKTQARKRAGNLAKRLTAEGYFRADDQDRPYWHASDAGLPVVALCRYLKKETDAKFRSAALNTIKKNLQYNLAVTRAVNNPFGYARQTFKYKGDIKTGFFIPHENETGWWWQGENARLASLATAALVGGKVAYAGNKAVSDSLKTFASQQLNWILGSNPYQACFMYKFGRNNVPHMVSSFGHGAERGGISNGITGKDGNADGSGIDYKISAEGNEWRWTEQWIPHAAWFLQALTALSTK